MKKTVLIILAIILAAALLFCLIYTRPRSLDSILGETGTPTSVYADTSLVTFRLGWTETDRWSVSGELADEAFREELVELLRNTRYRLSLRSLGRPNLLEGDYRTAKASSTLSLLFDGTRYASISFLGSAVGIAPHDEKSGFLIASVTDEEVLTQLSELIQRVGEKN